MAGWWRNYSLSCEPVDYSDSLQSRRVSCSDFYSTFFLLFCKNDFIVATKHKLKSKQENLTNCSKGQL